jgi:hypothetical protein
VTEPESGASVKVGFMLGPAEGQDTSDPDVAQAIQDWADETMGYAVGCAARRGLKLGTLALTAEESPWWDLRKVGFPERPHQDENPRTADFDAMTPLLVVLERLQMQMLDEDPVWVLPDSVLPGVTSAYGIPVVRAQVDAPLLGHTGSQSGREVGS